MLRALLIAVATWAATAVVLTATALSALVVAHSGDTVTAAVIAAVGVVAYSGVQYLAVHTLDRAVAAIREHRAGRSPAGPVDAVAVAAGVLRPERTGRHAVDTPTALIAAVPGGAR